MTVARASIALGAGRARKGDPIDLSVGIVLEAKVGERVEQGQPLAVLHANDEARLAQAEQVLARAFAVSTEAVQPPPLILERLGT
jgi:thymidine phosphorylase